MQNNSGKGPLGHKIEGVKKASKDKGSSARSQAKALQPHLQASGQAQTPQSGSSAKMRLSVSPSAIGRSHSPCRRIEVEVEPNNNLNPPRLTNASGTFLGSSQWGDVSPNQQHLRPSQDFTSSYLASNLKSSASHENLRGRLQSQNSLEIDPLSLSYPASSSPNLGNPYYPEYISSNHLRLPEQFSILNNHLTRSRSTEQLQVSSPKLASSWLGLPPRRSQSISPLQSPTTPKANSRSSSPIDFGPNKIHLDTNIIAGPSGGNRSPKRNSPKFFFGFPF